MHATHEQVGIEEMTSADFAALETWAPIQERLTPSIAARLWLQTSLRLTRAQKELHDAIFSHDGTDASLDRYASARAELDSAEAWALRVAKARYGCDQG
ncbi:FruA-associating protein, FapA [Pyxidicoccus sp. 3LG]